MMSRDTGKTNRQIHKKEKILREIHRKIKDTGNYRRDQGLE